MQNQWQIQERGLRGPGPPFLCLDETEARRAKKFFFGDWPPPPPVSKDLDDRPPPPLSQGLDPALKSSAKLVSFEW